MSMWSCRSYRIRMIWINQFYISIQKNDIIKKQWNDFVAGYYNNSEYKKAEFDELKDTFIYNDKNNIVEIQENNFKYWRNYIYEKLINNQSIIPQILKRSRKHKLSWNLIKIYEQNIRKMKKETITKIEQMADFILSSNDENQIKKAIKSKRITVDEFTNVFKKVEQSDFLTGRTGNWRCSFDWVLKPSNWQKISEGNYDNKRGDCGELTTNNEPHTGKCQEKSPQYGHIL